MEPNEQKTQQSPAFGRRSSPHPAQRWKKTQASVGIVSSDWWLHEGQRSVDRSCIGR